MIQHGSTWSRITQQAPVGSEATDTHLPQPGIAHPRTKSLAFPKKPSISKKISESGTGKCRNAVSVCHLGCLGCFVPSRERAPSRSAARPPRPTRSFDRHLWPDGVVWTQDARRREGGSILCGELDGVVWKGLLLYTIDCIGVVSGSIPKCMISCVIMLCRKFLLRWFVAYAFTDLVQLDQALLFHGGSPAEWDLTG